MANYTEEDRANAVAVWKEHGTAEAERRTGITGRTITRWAKAAGEMSQDMTQKTSTARAHAAEKVALQWGDYRSGEAAQAGAAAAHIRRQVIEASDEGNHLLLRARSISYGILIDKAELLSGNATERIEGWAESELDRDLKSLVNEMEEVIRNGNGEDPGGRTTAHPA